MCVAKKREGVNIITAMGGIITTNKNVKYATKSAGL
jgi:hypothetical protein